MSTKNKWTLKTHYPYLLKWGISYAYGSLTFLSFPDFLLGMSAAENGSGFSNVFACVDGFGLFDRGWRAWEGNLYYQDDIKPSSKFTLNAGLRYEHLGLYDDIHGRNSSFNPELANPNPPSSDSIQGFQGTVPPGVTRANSPYAVKVEGKIRGAPVSAFSWQLPHVTRLALRGGYGLYYSRPTGGASSKASWAYRSARFALMLVGPTSRYFF